MKAWKDPHILNLGTKQRWAISLKPWPSYPWEKIPSTYLTGGWMGPRAGLDVLEKRKILSRCRDSNRRIVHPVANHYND